MKYFVDYLPISTNNDLRLYIDGANYCNDLYAEISRAKKSILLTGLHFMADFKLVRTGGTADNLSSFAQVLASAADRGVQVFLLVNQFWKDEAEVEDKTRAFIRRGIMKSGELYGYLPESYRIFKLLSGYPTIHCRTDIHTNSDIFGTNHQKTVVIDDKVAYLGGIDLTFLDGDRWDTHDHKTQFRAIDRTQKYWHDIHMRVQGAAVEFVRDNFYQRWNHGALHILEKKSKIVARRDKNPPALPPVRTTKKSSLVYPNRSETADTPTVQIVRSMPRKDNWASEKPSWNIESRDWERSCKDAYLIGIAAAKQYIYLENQWVADENIWKALQQAAKRNKNNPDFRIILMVPYEGLFAAGLGSNQELFIGSEMEDVINASFDEGTFGMYSLVQKPQYPVHSAQIYVHSKILIIDDEWCLIGSANAGGISLEGVRTGKDEPDTELSAIVLDKKFAQDFRQKLWQEHLAKPVKAAYDARDADEFRRLAGKVNHNIRFFPGYHHIKRGNPTWMPWFLPSDPKQLSLQHFKKHSKISSSFHPELRWNLPVLLMRATFRAHVVPNPPPGFRVWYRWICQVDISEDYKPRLKLLSLKYDKDEVLEYSDQDAVYIGEKTARFIDRRVRDVKKGKILCRVQIIPRSEAPDPTINGNFPSLLLQYECAFMNSTFAKHNLDFGLLPVKK